MICGTIGDYHEHFSVVKAVFGYRDGVHTAGAMNALLLPSGNTLSPRLMLTKIHAGTVGGDRRNGGGNRSPLWY